MASWIKSWRRKHLAEAEYAAQNNIELITFSGQLSYMCRTCGAWWSVKLGIKHQCGGENHG